MRYINLSLGELRCATCSLESVLLSFLHTRVTGEKTCSLEERTIGLVCLKKCAGETVADCTCLTRDTAALNGADDIELTLGAGNGEGLIYDELESFETEILVNAALVYGNSACAGNDAYSCNRALSSAGAVEVRLCACVRNCHFR